MPTKATRQPRHTITAVSMDGHRVRHSAPARPEVFATARTRDPGRMTRDEMLLLQRVIGNRAIGELPGMTQDRERVPSRSVPESSCRNGHTLGQAAAESRNMTPSIDAPAQCSLERNIGQRGPLRVPNGFLRLSTAGGHPLPHFVRKKMESFFGASFSGVRVHVTTQARSLGARAFTVGDDIYFAPGQYKPTFPHGQRLLGHELTHVVQQRAGRVRGAGGNSTAIVQDKSLEAEADRLGRNSATFADKATRRAEGEGPVTAKAERYAVNEPRAASSLSGVPLQMQITPEENEEFIGNMAFSAYHRCNIRDMLDLIEMIDDDFGDTNKNLVILRNVLWERIIRCQYSSSSGFGKAREESLRQTSGLRP